MFSISYAVHKYYYIQIHSDIPLHPNYVVFIVNISVSFHFLYTYIHRRRLQAGTANDVTYSSECSPNRDYIGYSLALNIHLVYLGEECPREQVILGVRLVPALLGFSRSSFEVGLSFCSRTRPPKRRVKAPTLRAPFHLPPHSLRESPFIFDIQSHFIPLYNPNPPAACFDIFLECWLRSYRITLVQTTIPNRYMSTS